MGQQVSRLIIEKGMTKEDLIYEYAAVYYENPAMWDRIIAACQLNAMVAKTNLSSTANDSTSEAAGNISVPKEQLRNPEVVRFSHEILQEINKVRNTPQVYIKYLEERKSQFIDKNLYKPVDGVYLQTKEGILAVNEAIDTLKQISNSLEPMLLSEELEEASLDHANDVFANNLFSHTSSDGATIKDRVERYCIWKGSLGENIDFGSNDAKEIILNMLIDDGVPTRGHRKNIISKEYKFIGASLCPHATYHFCCVINFTCRVVKYTQVLRSDYIKQYNTIEEVNKDSTFPLVLNSIPYTGDLRKEISDELVVEGSSVIIHFNYDKKHFKLSIVKNQKTTTREMSWS